MDHNSLAAGFFLLMAGFSGFVRHGLLEPKMTRYPPAPAWLLVVVYAFATVMLYLGMHYIYSAFFSPPDVIPPQASARMVLLSFTVFTYKIAMLVNVVRQRLPAHLWNRLNKITATAHCWPRKDK